MKPKILVLYDKNGCCFWRSWLAGQEMQKQGLAEVHFVELKVSTKQELAQELKWCDIVHALGLIDTNGLAAIRHYKSLGLRVSIDCDDLHFNVSPFNPAYKHFGMEEVEVRNPSTGDIQYLWKDGKNGFDIKRNKIKFHAYKACLQEADLVTTTTVHLKEAMLEVSDGQANIKVLPNALNMDHWKPLAIRDQYTDKFRFGWAVSGSHGEDWLYIKPALVKFLETHKDATFVCIGDTYMDIIPSLPKGQVEWYPMSDLWELHYPLRMAMLGLDVAIAPLAHNEFNMCKSPLKYAEYTAFGWPVIAENMTPYKEHIVNGETGLLAGSVDEWVDCLNIAYSNSILMKKLKFNASFTLKELFDVKKVAHEWADTYKELLGVSIL